MLCGKSTLCLMVKGRIVMILKSLQVSVGTDREEGGSEVKVFGFKKSRMWLPSSLGIQ